MCESHCADAKCVILHILTFGFQGYAFFADFRPFVKLFEIEKSEPKLCFDSDFASIEEYKCNRLVIGYKQRKAAYLLWSNSQYRKNAAFRDLPLTLYSRSAPVNWKVSTTKSKSLNVSATVIVTRITSLR